MDVVAWSRKATPAALGWEPRRKDRSGRRGSRARACGLWFPCWLELLVGTASKVVP
jgi:hypothetical protein